MPHPFLLAAVGSAILLSACVPKAAAPVPKDKTAPVLVEVTPVPNSSYMNATPGYTFSSTEAGSITWGGGCASSTTSASSGNNTVTLNALAVGYYNNCTVKVTDAAGNASAELAITPFLVGKPYNDTGVTTCGDYAYSYTGYTGSNTHNNDLDCATYYVTQTVAGTDANGDAIPAGQDAHFGRDANPATNSNADGHKGFSFTKLSAVDGSPLAIQNGTWSDAGSEAAGTRWGCVQDNVTGLVWEVKTNDGGLRDKDWTYSWYNPDYSKNGGNAGYADYADNCYVNTRCDTAKYVADVNAGAGLCGATDWRLPRKDELQSIVIKDFSSLLVDGVFMPNTVNNEYWSALSKANNSTSAWVVYFNNGWGSANYKYSNLYVRLVRGVY